MTDINEIRKKLAHLPITMPSTLPKQFVGTDLADQILNTELPERECNNCLGGKIRGGIFVRRADCKNICPRCNGTGKLPPITIEQAILDKIKA